MAKRRYIGSIEIPDGRNGKRQIANKVIYAPSLENAQQQYERWLKEKGNVPVWANEYSQTKSVVPALEFEIETKKVKAIRWWEKAAIEDAEYSVKEPDYLVIDLESLAQSIEDGWSEHIQRDGEPGPRPGNVDFEVNDEGTKLTIRSTRILALITMKL